MRFVYLFLCLPYLLQAQLTGPSAKGWQELTISDGLSQGMIFDIKQDHKGFLWIATKYGLNRYDGHTFKVFTHDPYNPFTLSENVCTALLIDRHKRIWIGTKSKGLNLLNPKTGRFYHITINAGSVDNSISYAITQLAEDPEGNIWISTENDKLVKVSLPESLRVQYPDQADFTRQVKLIPIVVQDNQEKTYPWSLRFTAHQQLLAYTWNSLYTLNWKNPASIRNLNLFDPKEVHHIMGAYSDSLQNYWFTIVQNKLYSLHQGKVHTTYLKTDVSIRVHIKALDLQRIAVLTTGYLWIMSPGELYQVDSLTSQNAFAALPPNTFGVTSLLEDQTGNFWIGTMGYGLRKYNPRIRVFRSYLPNISLSHITIDQQGRAIVRLYSEIIQQNQQRQFQPVIPPSTALENRPEWFVLPDRQGGFWSFNTRRGTNVENSLHELLQFSADWKLLRRYTLPLGCRLGAIGNQALQDPEGNIWIGAVNGKLLRFFPETEQFQVIDYGSVFPKIGAKIEVYSLQLDPDNTL